MGPTCSGKTELANYLIDKLGCEAINFDAFQIYKDMNIGTAKLAKDDPHYSKYHLLDIKSPEESFSVKEYQELCRNELDKILSKNKDVVLVGGTGLYVRAALFDYQFEDEVVPVDEDLNNLTNEELHALLTKLDPLESEKIHVNNRKRLLRAISLIRHANKSKSDILSNQQHKPIYKDVRFIYISPNREKLYNDIDNRVLFMLENGLIDEVKSLLKKYKLSLTASQGIGYKEVIDYLQNKIKYEDCVALIQKRTRNYAKRQVTFFKNQFESEIYASIEEAKERMGL
jgi:tRNA dimethylallyltransferase